MFPLDLKSFINLIYLSSLSKDISYLKLRKSKEISKCLWQLDCNSLEIRKLNSNNDSRKSFRDGCENFKGNEKVFVIFFYLFRSFYLLKWFYFSPTRSVIAWVQDICERKTFEFFIVHFSFLMAHFHTNNFSFFLFNEAWFEKGKFYFRNWDLSHYPPGHLWALE